MQAAKAAEEEAARKEAADKEAADKAAAERAVKAAAALSTAPLEGDGADAPALMFHNASAEERREMMKLMTEERNQKRKEDEKKKDKHLNRWKKMFDASTPKSDKKRKSVAAGEKAAKRLSSEGE